MQSRKVADYGGEADTYLLKVIMKVSEYSEVLDCYVEFEFLYQDDIDNLVYSLSLSKDEFLDHAGCGEEDYEKCRNTCKTDLDKYSSMKQQLFEEAEAEMIADSYDMAYDLWRYN